MADIDAYEEFEKYMQFQNKRPDYKEAIRQSIDLAVKYAENKKGIVVADFCCGTGSNTKLLADKIGGIKKAILIDINSGFLDIARKSGMSCKELDIRNSDILSTKLKHESDIVLSIFAYHHINDDEKDKYVQQAKNCLTPKGVLILAEIFLKDKKRCVEYYEKLIREIPKKDQIPGLLEFLRQTALSEDFEFKVEKKFADEQFLKAGFRKLEEIKIWPQDNSFKPDEGTFLQVYSI